MSKRFFIPFVIINIIYSQVDNNQKIVQENSVYWKTGIDRLILRDGEVLYGEYVKKEGKKILFKKEYQDSIDIIEASDIRDLVLANGRVIIRENKDNRIPIFCLGVFTIFYISNFHYQIR